MYIQNLQCNVKLIQEQQLLEERLQQVKNIIKNNEQSCSHIGIILGYIEHLSHKKENEEGIYNRYYTCKCILCNKALEAHKSVIDASTYNEKVYHHGSSPEEIYGRLNEIQTIVSEYIKENPFITQEEVIERLSEEINQDILNQKQKSK